ncbi:4Fe-4S cluster-binding domain-containing protein [Myxococcus sp. K15C18031901]|uniref:radical SAM protein n=1 Tax=Myxococcus dinghuensis TaxID=2906761 RepID=UPI0020A76481|nr:radical SAM protein [Myxococcus dinghuensis]MCP3102944.1 4Fe-4S cluster-binding domain-containing protein [Myxococcus dinghuensis]
MRTEGRRYKDEWLPNFYPSRKVGPDHHVRLSRTGSLQILSSSEDAQLSEIFMDAPLFERLESSGHIVTEANASQVMKDLKTWHLKTFLGAGLHLVVLTKRCNLNCTYCHMNPEPMDARQLDMSKETIDEVIRFAMSTPSPRITFEFQGGEPFLNFDGMVHFVEEAKRQNATVGKLIDFSVTTNLMVVTEQHMEFCRQNNINVSYSLNGPPDIHDGFRVTRSGAGSFRTVMQKLQEFQQKYPDILSTSPLCVVGDANAQDFRRTIDFYHDMGFKGVGVIKLKHLGNTVKNGLRFDVKHFLKHYLAALDYIYEKNQRLGENYSERTLRVLMAKIISKTDVGYVDWSNPCGDFSGSIVYDYDGEIVPSDEARSLRHVFGLGNVRNVTYAGLVEDRNTFRTMNLSLRDRDAACRECAYNPYCGVVPVLDYARTGDATPRPHESDECLQVLGILDWVFQKLVEDPLPLIRMLPGMEQALMTLAAPPAESTDAAA